MQKMTVHTEDAAEAVIQILYHTDAIDRIDYIAGKSDWIDLRSAETVSLRQGDFHYLDLGISVRLPEGYEMLIAPRSSTFKNFGILQPNSPAVIDESYSSDEDVLRLPVLAMRDTVIHVNDRVCQFRILRHQPRIRFEQVQTLGGSARGGFGSTGVQ